MQDGDDTRMSIISKERQESDEKVLLFDAILKNKNSGPLHSVAYLVISPAASIVLGLDCSVYKS